MTPITITGALSMISTNGDGAQLLTEAAEFLNALAQMGVQMAVEINLRPIGSEKAAAPVLLNPGPPVDLVLRTQEPAYPAPAPMDPPPAAPAQPEEPPTTWRKLNQYQRMNLASRALCDLRDGLGEKLTQAEYREMKPDWMPGPETLISLFGTSWAQIWERLEHQS